MSSSTSAQFPELSLAPKLGSKASSVSPTEQDQKEIPDEVLLRLIKNNDRDALAVLFRRYAASVHNLGSRILRNSSEADDLVQEVFLYLYKKSTLFDSSKGAARSWIFQVAYTQALLRRRELKAQGFYLSGILDKQIEWNQGVKLDGAEYDHSVEGLFGRNGWKKVVKELTEDQRETLRLHFFEGLTFAEIAHKLGQSHRNIRNHHYRGLEKVRKYLAEGNLNWR